MNGLSGSKVAEAGGGRAMAHGALPHDFFTLIMKAAAVVGSLKVCVEGLA